MKRIHTRESLCTVLFFLSLPPSFSPPSFLGVGWRKITTSYWWYTQGRQEPRCISNADYVIQWATAAQQRRHHALRKQPVRPACFQWTETNCYLFLGDAHVVLDPRKDGGVYEEALLAHSWSTILQLGSLFLPTLYQIHNLVKLLLVNLKQTSRQGKETVLSNGNKTRHLENIFCLSVCIYIYILYIDTDVT